MCRYRKTLTFIFTLPLLLIPLLMPAQTKWSVLQQQKALLKMVEENPGQNKISLSPASLTRAGNLTVLFSRHDTASIRSIIAMDGRSQELKRWEKVARKLAIPHAELAKLLAANKEITLYYLDIPKDPELAAVVRVRMIELCNIRLK